MYELTPSVEGHAYTASIFACNEKKM